MFIKNEEVLFAYIFPNCAIYSSTYWDVLIPHVSNHLQGGSPHPPNGTTGAVNHPPDSFFFRSSFNSFGLALPFVAFMTCPTKKPKSFSFPCRNSST